jgi:hypothetical protein
MDPAPAALRPSPKAAVTASPSSDAANGKPLPIFSAVDLPHCGLLDAELLLKGDLEDYLGDEKMRRLRDLWALALKPDNNLGRSAPGASPQGIRLGAALKVIRALLIAASAKPAVNSVADLSGAKRFVDLGSGKGLVCEAFCQLLMGVVPDPENYVFGVENDQEQLDFVRRYLPQRRTFRNADLGEDGDWYRHPRTDLPPALVYTFDKDFKSEVRASIALGVSAVNRSVLAFASARRKENWENLVDYVVPLLLEKRNVPVDSAVKMFYDAKRFFSGLQLVFTVKAGLQGSGEKHMIYVYRNPDAVYKGE